MLDMMVVLLPGGRRDSKSLYNNFVCIEFDIMCANNSLGRIHKQGILFLKGFP